MKVSPTVSRVIKCNIFSEKHIEEFFPQIKEVCDNSRRVQFDEDKRKVSHPHDDWLIVDHKKKVWVKQACLEIKHLHNSKNKEVPLREHKEVELCY